MKRMIFGLAAFAALFGGPGDVTAQQFQVIVHEDVALDEISVENLSNIFQKKARRLPSGESANPVDQGEGASVREAFSQAVHSRSATQLGAFWQQQIFSGREFPPEQMGSDDEVVAYVSRTPGAIGYVSARANLGTGVKVLRVTG